MGFKNFLSNFVEITPSESTPPPASIPNTPSQTVSSIPSGYYDNKQLQPHPSSKMMENFRNVLNQSNLPGPDLKEVIDSLDEITDLPDDKKYSMVFKILSKNGLTMDKIEKSYSVYLNAIKNNQSGFEELIATTNKSIEAKEARIPNIDSEIKSLEAKILELQTEKTKISSSIVEEKANIQNKTYEYNLAKEHYTNLLTTTYNNIKKFN